MSLNYVTLTGTIPGAGTGTLVKFTPSNWLADPTDLLLIPPAPEPVYCTAAGTFSISLLATDNAAPTPPGWFWTVAISGVPGVAYTSFSFFLKHSDGGTQDISTLAQVEPADVMQAYLPLPSGTPEAGQVPVATGSGDQTEWASTSGTTGYPAEPVVSGTPSAGQVLTATSATTADWQTPASGGGVVDSVAAGDASIVVGGTTANPTVETGTLDEIATLLPPAANVPMNSKKLTGLAHGSSAGDSVAFDQLGSAALQPSSAFDASGAAAAAQAASLQKTSNLSDLASASTARTNLGLGSAATQNSSAFDASGAAATAQANAEANAASTYVPLSEVGAASGVASLNGAGTVPSAELPTLDQVPSPAANVAMANHKLTGLANGTAASDAAAFGQLPSSSSPLPTTQGGTGLSEANLAALLVAMGVALLTGASFSGEVTAQTPVNPSDVATKAYVDAVAQNLSVKPSVQEATATALPANTYSAGVLTANSNGSLTVDGIAVALNDRVLVQNEATAAHNGIYTVTATGSGAAPYQLTRATDMNTGSQVPGAFVFVEQGSVNAQAGFVVIGEGPFTIGTTAINWSQFSGAGEITAGTGLTKTGNTLGLSVPVSPANGGTGQTTLQAALNALAASVASGQYLRGNGSNVVMAAIQAADVPTLNQNTTGNAATATNLAGGATLPGYLAPAAVALTFVGGGTTLVNAALGNAFNLTLTASTTTIGNPSNPVDGQTIRFRLTQGAGGSFTVAWGTAYDFGAAGSPTLSTAVGKVDVIAFEYVASLSKWIYLGAAQGN